MPAAHSNRWVLLVTVAAGLLLIVLDNSVLYTALPTLTRELGATATQGLWIINAYPLVMAGLLLVYVTSGPLKDPSGSGQQASSRPLDPAYRISDSLGLSPTIIVIAVAVGILMWLLVNRTAFGVLASLAGRNGTMVEWQGARLWKLGLSSFLISGALAGLAGTIEFMGPNGRIASGFLPAHGFTAILIALVANLSVLGTAVAAVFFGGLASAALYLPIMAGLPSAAIDIINAAIALFITARSTVIDKVLRLGGRKT